LTCRIIVNRKRREWDNGKDGRVKAAKKTRDEAIAKEREREI
jgi:hypothetical protein